MSRSSKRKARIGEVVCRCHAYRFPHRMLGGRCDGGAFVQKVFDKQLYGTCLHCTSRVEVTEPNYEIQCQVLDGLEDNKACDALDEYIRFESIKRYGVNK